MADLLDQLKAALADRYSMERLLVIGALTLPLACGEPADPDYATLVITTTSLGLRPCSMRFASEVAG